jgi:hypothetical protein
MKAPAKLINKEIALHKILFTSAQTTPLPIFATLKSEWNKTERLRSKTEPQDRTQMEARARFSADTSPQAPAPNGRKISWNCDHETCFPHPLCCHRSSPSVRGAEAIGGQTIGSHSEPSGSAGLRHHCFCSFDRYLQQHHEEQNRSAGAHFHLLRNRRAAHQGRAGEKDSVEYRDYWQDGITHGEIGCPGPRTSEVGTSSHEPRGPCLPKKSRRHLHPERCTGVRVRVQR